MEQGIKGVKEQASTMIAALEERLGGRLPIESPIFAWAIGFESVLFNYFKEGSDDRRTPLERHRGAKHERPIAGF